MPIKKMSASKKAKEKPFVISDLFFFKKGILHIHKAAYARFLKRIRQRKVPTTLPLAKIKLLQRQRRVIMESLNR